MPAMRCKWYTNDGKPIGPGCRNQACQFVHPNQKAHWDSLPAHKVHQRCPRFDSHGNLKGEPCRDGRTCRFIHPNDPRWAMAPSSVTELPDRPPIRQSTAHRTPTSHDPPTSNTLSVADTVRKSLPKLQTDMFKESYKTVMPDTTLKHRDTPTSANVRDPRPLSRRASGITPADLSVPNRMSSLDPTQSPLAASSTTGGSKQQAWKILYQRIAQAVNLHEQLRDADRRISLYSMDNISTLPSSSQLDGLLNAEKAKKKNVEDELDAIITQLVEMDFWPVPTAEEMPARSGHAVHFDAYGEVIKKLDEVEAQLKKRTEFRTSFSEVNSSTMALDNADIAEQSSRPPKRRRTSPRGSFIRTSDVKDVKDRLERMENKMHEMEKGGIWDSDQASERIEEFLERAFQQPRAHVGEGPLDSGKGASSVSEPSQKPVETLMLNLNRNFAALCDEFAGHLPAVGKLETDVERLRVESANSKETMTSLDSSYQRLREQLDSLSLQTKDISSELVNRGTMADPRSNMATDRDYIRRMAAQDIKQHIASVRDELTNHMTSQFRDVQSTLLTDYESTIAQTDYIHDAMAGRFEAEPLGE